MNESGPNAKQSIFLRIFLAFIAVGLVATMLLAVIATGWRKLHSSDKGFSRERAQEAAAIRPITPRGNLADNERTTIELFERSSPSVVFITTLVVQRNAFTLDIMQIPRGTGSGFIWDKQGHVVTNLHVVSEGNAARVTLEDGSAYRARLVGQAPDKDLAVLKIDAPADRLHPIPLGKSAGLKVGQSVFAIGNPFGLDQTLSVGVISGLGREVPSSSGGTIGGAIQTDAAINPGNSGGPLLDSAGRLIGVNTAIFSPTGVYAGVGFAIPADTVNFVVPQLITHGRVIRPRIGVQIADDTLVRRLKLKGVMIAAVEVGSPAQQAGLRGFRHTADGSIALGDLIVGIESKPVNDTDDLFRVLEEHAAGDRVVLNVVREGARFDVKVTLAPGS